MQDSSNTEKAALRKSSVLFAESKSSVVDGTRIIRTKLQQKRFKEDRGKKKKSRRRQGENKPVQSRGSNALERRARGDYEIPDGQSRIG